MLTCSRSAWRRTRSRPTRSRRCRRSSTGSARNGGLPYLAHTYWSGLRTEQWEGCEGLLGLEVWNTGCELEVGRGDSSIHWDEALERGAALQGACNR